MSEVVLRSAVERLQSLLLEEEEEETTVLNGSARRALNFILKQLNQMQVLLKGKDKLNEIEEKVRQIEQLNYQIEGVVQSAKIWRRINGIRMLWLRKLRLNFTLQKIKSEMGTIIKQIEDIVIKPVNTSRSVLEQINDNDHHLTGLEEDVKRMRGLLLSDSSSSSSSVIPIYGVVGSGKTALAKLVYEDPAIAKKFEIRKWIDVPHKVEIGYILDQIMELGDRWMSYCSSEEQVFERIQKTLASKKSLIVLDDIRSIEAWETLSTALPKLDPGSYLVLTTRVGYVAEYISQKQFQFVHNMTPLNELHSWALFDKVFSHRDPSVNLPVLELDRSSRAQFTIFTNKATTSSTKSEIGFEGHGYTTFGVNLPSAIQTDNNREREMLMEMVRCCDGSPQLIKSLALYLRSKKSDQELEMVHKNTRAVLSEFCCLVYDELPDHLQPCFMYLGHFLEDQSIDPEKLSHLWMIEGLLSTGQSAKGERMMDMTERYLRELALKGMVEVQAEEVPATKKLKACRFVHGMEIFCVSNCEQKSFLKIIDLRQEKCSLSSSEGPRRLVIYLGKHKVDIPPKVAKNIRSLRVVLLRNQEQIIENELVCPTKMLNLKEFGVLRILDFDGIDFQRQKLPTGISNLEFLRYLSFKGCVLEELPSSISKLSYLQVFDLRVKGLDKIKIPNVLLKMRRLNHLYLPQEFATQNGEKLQLDSLIELETLVNFNTRLCRANDVSRLCKLRHLAAKVEENFSDFESITNYMKTSTSNNWPLQCSIDIINLDCYAEERRTVVQEFLHCKVLRTLQFQGYIGRLPPYDKISQNLTLLVLKKSYIKEDPMSILEKLPSLEILMLSDDAYIGKEMVCSASGFPQLKCLQLLNLSEMLRVKMENTAMPILSTVEIKNCQKLDIKNCGKLETLLLQ